MPARPLRWGVFVANLNPTVGHEQAGERRVLVVSYEPVHRAGMVSVCPITAARSVVRYPNEIAIPTGEAGQTLPGVILCHQIRTISVLRFKGDHALVGYLTDPSLRAQVREALAVHLGLDLPPITDGMAVPEPSLSSRLSYRIARARRCMLMIDNRGKSR